MKESCIAHTPKQKLVILKEDYQFLADNNNCAAILLQIFEYWTDYKFTKNEERKLKNDAIEKKTGNRPLDENDFWIYKTEIDLSTDTLGLYKERTIRDSLKILMNKKYVTRRNNPKYRWDRTYQYLFSINTVQKDINTYMKKKKCLNESAKIPDRKGSSNTNRSGKNVSAIPEITIEITKENTKDLIENKNNPFVDQKSKNTKVKSNRSKAESNIAKLRYSFEIAQKTHEAWYNTHKSNVASAIVKANEQVAILRKKDKYYNLFCIVTDTVRYHDSNAFNVLSKKMIDWNSRTKKCIERLFDAGFTEDEVVEFTKWRLDLKLSKHIFTWDIFLADTFVYTFLKQKKGSNKVTVGKDFYSEENVGKRQDEFRKMIETQ